MLLVLHAFSCNLQGMKRERVHTRSHMFSLTATHRQPLCTRRAHDAHTTMATIHKLPSGSWRAQVRRKGQYASDVFRLKDDAQRWVRDTESRIERNENLALGKPLQKVTLGDLIEAEWAYDFMTRHGVTHSFMTPTALKRLAQVENPRVTERPSPLQAKSRARSCGLECKDAKVDSWLIGCRVADQSGPSQR